MGGSRGFLLWSPWAGQHRPQWLKAPRAPCGSGFVASAVLVVFRVSELKWEHEPSLGDALSAGVAGSGLGASGPLQKKQGAEKV